MTVETNCSAFVRVISGELGGRRLQAPAGNRTRPTSDRVREAMFMALEPLAGLRVVDLYSGSGALGIEALSRGAARADFVEVSVEARRALAGNLAALGLTERARIWRVTLPRGLRSLGSELSAADLVLADPPYGGREAQEILAALGAASVLKEGARVVLEHHAKDDVSPQAGRLVRVRERRYGETMVSTYQIAGGSSRVDEESQS